MRKRAGSKDSVGMVGRVGGVEGGTWGGLGGLDWCGDIRTFGNGVGMVRRSGEWAVKGSLGSTREKLRK
jgi:hypothetical protein